MYKAYKISRDRAWQTLIETNVNVLPVDLKHILKFYGIRVALLDSNTKQAFIENNVMYINKNLSKARGRFTVAHELGHILLNHKDLSHTIHNENNNKNIEEFQANIFARGLLMPAIVLKEINCIDAQDIANICNVSLQSAQYRSERMQELLKRNKFNLSPLEKQVYSNFKDFVNNNKI
ncbi:ImmA/IrrE family metallo-endopeptidase [[Clostridium] colinum]|uniref:ImmA/IrrE family metallo-endopeptidase n=1 Tax=[Clostridium] colinum TaxID=36835 RepID=UPI0020250987|nr:ImmA/IrrE family metallo-endopeptidase [[Clostridium] colinum]